MLSSQRTYTERAVIIISSYHIGISRHRYDKNYLSDITGLTNIDFILKLMSFPFTIKKFKNRIENGEK